MAAKCACTVRCFPLKISPGNYIGSSSTKLAAVDADTREVVVDIYTRPRVTAAGLPTPFWQPCAVLKESQAVISACGTTGSGRRLVGRVVGADCIVNEITAHFSGAHEFDPEIETIFEIGGQDAKYIRGRHGAVIDCNMNFVCAAGTGSFIEEQAARLGFDVREVGSLVLDLTAPHTSDRCTVFMEQDINKLLRDGYSRREVLAGVVRSIVKNYMNRVVGSRAGQR
jgi:predicted CoA-substrate-specific enzyme activase